MIDTHCHLTYDGLHERVDRVIADAAEAGVDRMVSVGTSPADARKAIALTKRYDNVYATVGLHPHYAADWSSPTVLTGALRELVSEPKVVALGEMGLDQHYPDPPMAMQRSAFAAQLGLAAELGSGVWGLGSSQNKADASEALSDQTPDPGPQPLPIVIHNREATDDTLVMIADSGLPGERFVFHCFTGSPGEVEQVLAIGAMVSFTGIVTFKNAKGIAEASDLVPLERLMIETDSPYLAPEPYRKVRPNEPRYVVHVAEFLARRRGMSMEAFVQAVDANAERFFGLNR